MNLKKTFILFWFPLFIGLLHGQPLPGDVFKEYNWFNESGDCVGALRIGGPLDYKLFGKVDNYQGNGQINPPFNVDLKRAVRAELLVEKMLCHGGTEGLRISINGNDPIYLPVPDHIPEPQSEYAHHFTALVPVDLSTLKPGAENSFAFQVDTAGHWWPQNLVYGMTLRVYYENTVLKERGTIKNPSDGETLGKTNRIALQVPSKDHIEKIDLIGLYEDVDLEGDGLYRKWHYSFHQCRIYNHIGTISKPPFDLTWNAEWIPDQQKKIQLVALIHQIDGYIYMTKAVKNLKLIRDGVSVELCKPYKRPKGWFTRAGVFEQRFQIGGELDKAIEAKMVFRTWSPGYFNGIYINDFLVFIKEGPKYAYFEHDIPVTDLHVFVQGQNILKTGKTPRYHGEMVHGVEVQWPGIMLLIKYDLTSNNKSQIH